MQAAQTLAVQAGPVGQSGWSPEGARGLKTDLAAELNARHTIQINKLPVTDTRQRLMMRTLAIRAASGDLKAQQILLPMILQVLGVDDRGTAKARLSPNDQALLDQLLAGPVEVATPDAIDGDEAGPTDDGEDDG